MAVPAKPKIYHIVHIDKLPSIIADGCLWCDAEMVRRKSTGTSIGMNKIKQRRLSELMLMSYPDLHVGDCVPFYFCPRSIMLYVIHRANHEELNYRQGQASIIHLQADLYSSVAWAKQQNQQRWAFTLSNAGSYYFEDRCNLDQLNEINWPAVLSTQWQSPSYKEGKQAEFLIEYNFPWHLIERIGVNSQSIYQQVIQALQVAEHKPKTEIKPEWYY